MSILSDTAPKRIWLCVSDDEDDYELPYPELYAEDAEITWSTDQPVAVTIEYVRNDLSEIARLRQDLAAARALLLGITSAYNAYRRRGVAPAPTEYADVVRAIVQADAALAAQESSP